jgi:hypothetical protein
MSDSQLVGLEKSRLAGLQRLQGDRTCFLTREIELSGRPAQMTTPVPRLIHTQLLTNEVELVSNIHPTLYSPANCHSGQPLPLSKGSPHLGHTRAPTPRRHAAHLIVSKARARYDAYLGGSQLVSRRCAALTRLLFRRGCGGFGIGSSKNSSDASAA